MLLLEIEELINQICSKVDSSKNIVIMSQVRPGFTRKIQNEYQQQANNTYALVKTTIDSKPLDHIPPNYGRVSLQYEQNKLYGELYMMYNGWKRLDKYNLDKLD